MRRQRGSRGGRAAACALLLLATAPPAHAREQAVASAEVADAPETVWALLTDFDGWEQLFPAVSSLAVERVDARSARLHTRTRVAGLSVRYTLAATLDAAARRLDCTLDRREPADIEALTSSWRVRATDGGGARIELVVRAESGLALPGFVERRFTALVTRASLDALVAALGAQRVALAAD